MSDPHPQFISRSLLLWWTLWLIVSFAMNLRLDGGTPVAGAVTMQWTLEAALAGLMLAWPVLRLSQRTPAHPTFNTTGDLVALLGVLQMVIWPVGLTRIYWTADQTTALVVAFIVYGLVTGLVVDTAQRRGPVTRVLGMAVCVALFAGGTLAIGEETTLMGLLLAPPRAVWWLAGDASPHESRAALGAYGVVAAGCVFAWVGLAAWAGTAAPHARNTRSGLG